VFYKEEKHIFVKKLHCSIVVGWDVSFYSAGVVNRDSRIEPWSQSNYF
jgi:hypothetical protein